ncbi:MAG TPA: FAD-dependent oxidoreductase, partial [Solirubrobacteraceae bacterium]|nr:FAD-dependent oxidoreductase [Solirubrobacteraceae bacterium]
RLDEAMHGLIQDIEGGYVDSVAFVAPGRMAWQLPLYELALMTAGRAYDMGVELETTIVSPEDGPLAIFGSTASSALAAVLAKAGIKTIYSAYAEVPRSGEIVINPGDRHLHVDRVIALPELYGPSVRGIPLSEHGFIRADRFGRVADLKDVYAAGDAIDFPIKHGGLGSQQADVVAQSIAALAGADVTPEPFKPVIHGMLLTGEKPLYLTARITGGQGFSSEITDEPTWSPPSKIAAKYLAPYLERLDRDVVAAGR